VEQPESGISPQLRALAIAAPGRLHIGGGDTQALLVLANATEHRLDVIALDGTHQGAIGALAPGSLVAPAGAWAAPDGGVFVSDMFTARVKRYAADGSYSSSSEPRPGEFLFQGAYNPITRENEVSVGLGVERFSTDGTALGRWAVSLGDSYGLNAALAIGADGITYAPLGSDFTTGQPDFRSGSVVAFDTAGNELRRIAGTNAGGPGDLDIIQALAVGPAQELYVANDRRTAPGGTGLSSIDVFTPAGTYLRSITTLSCTQVYGLTVDPLGNIYAGLRGRVVVLNATGLPLVAFGAGGLAPGQFVDGALSVDALGVLSIAERENARVTRVHMRPEALLPSGLGICGATQLLSTTVGVAGALVGLPVSCGGLLPQQCDGVATLLTAPQAKKAHSSRRVVLGSARYRIPANARQTVKIRLTPKYRKLLRQHHRLSVIAELRTNGLLTRRKVTLRQRRHA
jgi:hypothetical protein